MKKRILIFVALLHIVSLSVVYAANDTISLSGKWSVYLDSTLNILSNKTEYLNQKGEIILPGTTDDAGLGLSNKLLPKLERQQVLRLTRNNSFIGKAIYIRTFTLPRGINNKNILIKLERILWQSELKINGKKVTGLQESLSAPHYFDITDYVKVGVNSIELMIDNRKKYDISTYDFAHAYTNETQIMWNGVLGEMLCLLTEKVRVDNIQIFPEMDKRSIRIIAKTTNTTNKNQKATLTFKVEDKNTTLKTVTVPITINPKGSSIELNYEMGENTIFWDEFTPQTYILHTTLKWRQNKASHRNSFGIRKITNKSSALQINGNPMFLRGTLECAIFPLKGHPPMTKEGWMKVFSNSRKWGLNHLRFHSWCPPKAAFEVADEMGFYLQVELPLWSRTLKGNTPTAKFLYEEAERIIREYGNHPSFCFWSIGNELQSDFIFLNTIVKHLKDLDNRRLYTATSFTFEEGHGRWPEPNDDFFITQTTKKGWVRGQGVFDAKLPNFSKDYSSSVEGMTLPLITHEIGQYAVYPNINEIEKYTGVLDPLNFKAIKADLQVKGLLPKANDFLLSSGKLAVILYKEEIERALKTSGISGYQLLDLHDFPGQGTALVGLLDAFWDSKGLIEAEDFRNFCSPIVPLIRFEKATYKNNEKFSAKVEISNFSNDDLKNRVLKWKIRNKTEVTHSGKFNISSSPKGILTDAGTIIADLSNSTVATNLIIEVEIENSNVKNSWQIWVYPSILTMPNDIAYSRHIEEAIGLLKLGKKVLFNPAFEKINGLEGKFSPVFWSPVHFPKQAGTMGILCNPSHKAFEHFPTEMHTNWQWWSLLKRSSTLVIDSYPEITPLIEMIDNFFANRKLCNTFEAKVGAGRLLFTTIDLVNDMESRPEAKQLKYSLLKYMESEAFCPSNQIDEKTVMSFISNTAKTIDTNPESIY